MKKLLALLLAAALLFSAAGAVFAADAAPGEGTAGAAYPVVIARGMDFNRLYTNYGTADETPLFRGVSFGGIVKTLASALKNAGKEGFNHAFAVAAVDYARGILGDMACDETGASVKDVGYARYFCSAADSPELQRLLAGSDKKEEALVRSAVEEFGAENVYFYTYDFRLDPWDLADDLRDFIDLACAEHGTDRADLVNCSMSGVITDCYLYKYGGEKLRKCVFLSSTFCGTNVATEVLKGEVQTDADMLYRYLSQLTKSPVLAKMLKVSGLLTLAAKWFNGFVTEEKDYVYASFLRDTFGTMLSFWANVQPEDVDAALEMIFPGDELKARYAPLIEKIRRLQTVMEQREEMLKALPARGVEPYVVAGYNSAPIPLYPSAAEQTDAILDSRWMFGCAEVSLLGGALAAEGKYVSPDGCVDLSGAVFPDYTWAIRNAGHVPTVHGSDCTDLVLSLLRHEGQADVNTFPRFPQFFTVDGETKNIVPEKEPVC